MKTKDVDICTVDGQRELTIFFLYTFCSTIDRDKIDLER